MRGEGVEEEEDLLQFIPRWRHQSRRGRRQVGEERPTEGVDTGKNTPQTSCQRRIVVSRYLRRPLVVILGTEPFAARLLVASPTSLGELMVEGGHEEGDDGADEVFQQGACGRGACDFNFN